jgi:ribonuclease HII
MWLCLLDEDPRKGRRDLAQRLRRQREREQLAQERWRALSDFDSKMAAGDILAGVDEVGRGPLAGPVTAAAVILPQNFHAPGLDDSKRLSSDAREFWSTRIRAEATAWAVADLPAGEVDRLGIREAVFRVMRSAVDLLDVRPARVIVDGRDIPPGLVNARAVVRGDSRSLSVAAASVVAKVHRDALMCAADLDHPVYGFAGHKGYGSPEHLKVLRNMGPCPLHRRSFLGRILNTREEEAGEPR